MIARFKTKKIDAGYVDNHCFANVLSGGMFSDIGFLVTKEEKERNLVLLPTISMD